MGGLESHAQKGFEREGQLDLWNATIASNMGKVISTASAHSRANFVEHSPAASTHFEPVPLP